MNTKIKFKTPVSYYGGKQRLAREIVSRIPEHTLYCEPFTGGAAIFFAKDSSHVEVLNDTNKELMNFYRTLQRDFGLLEREVRITLHSRDLHRKASVIYNNPDMFDEIKRAWAFWVQSSQSFSAIIDSSWGYDKSDNTTTKKINNKIEGFNENLAIRLQNVQLECTDALYVIRSRDTDNSFFYCDPPYVGSDCGHYDGYTEMDFEALLTTLSQIKGRFLLSSYPSQLLKKYQRDNGWFTVCFEQKVSVAAKSGNPKSKIEVLTANYPIEK